MPSLRLAPALAALALSCSHAQILDTPDGVVADLPVNYTEARIGEYTLPDPLRLESGEPVTDAATWWNHRRPEIFRLLEENQFGRVPGRPPALRFDAFDSGTLTFDGQARRKQVTLYFSDDDRDSLDLLVYLPAKARQPVPVLVMLGWTANHLAVEDAGVKVGRTWDAQQKTRVSGAVGRRFGPPLDVQAFLARGWGVATFNYQDVDPDDREGLPQGIRARYLTDGTTQPAADEWGAIAAWGWGISRVVDYLETDEHVDAQRIAIMGASRLGKTVLWAAARDERIAAVIASVSGEGGAALSRRNYGETVAHLVAPSRYPYQFAGNYARWAGRAAEAPFDAHFILALLAPRPVLLQTGNTDKWSDPYGEFLAAKAATPVYQLLGQTGIEVYSLPPPGQPLLNRLGYLMHDGGHGIVPADWPVFFQFLEQHVRSE